jgi:type II secretory pathway pseudopilin PulG
MKKTDLKMQGYTMVEITVAFIVMSVMVSLAIPRFTTTMERYRSNEGVMVLNQLLFAQHMAGVDIAEGRIINYSLATLDVQIPNMDNFTNPPTIDFNGAGAPPTVNLGGTNYPIYSSVVRVGGAYTLYIQGMPASATSVPGRVLCNPQPICRRMNFAPW